MSRRELEELVQRLKSIDANDRVKAAAEIGEMGTPNEAPIVLKSAWDDETSTVRQMAIQSYFEILGESALSEILIAAQTHFDDYVKIYAISLLGKLDPQMVSDPLAKFLSSENPKIRTTALRAMIHANTRDNSDRVHKHLVNEDNHLAQKNAIEALVIWKVKDSKDSIEKILTERDNLSIEVKTMALFALAAFGSEDARIELETADIDEYTRINLKNKTYRGRNGLLDALTNL
ncbi:MAG: HEAT repeat domain-containing protein [Candidatus Kariarchaeaceae archaeon]